MKKIPKFLWAVFACIICIIVTAAACLILSDKGASSDKYLEIIKIINSNYYTEKELVNIEDASAAAMISSLQDPWSYYMTASEYEAYKLSSTNQYIGIGVTLEFSEKYGFLSVLAVSKGSPADRANIKVGNMIAAVNGIDVSSYTPEQFDELIQSYYSKDIESSETIKLQLYNSQGGKAEVSLKCELIYTDPTIYYMIEDSYIGYIKILNFDDSAASSLKASFSALEDLGARSIIIDIRDNQTGKPSELSAALDYLLPKCDLFLLTDRSGRETTYSSDKSAVKIPIVVMVNENSSCAAEIFAYCMQQNGGATIVGRRTMANSLSQVVVELDDGSAVRISKYQYLTPDKKSMEQIGGVTPNVVSYQIEDSDMDVQLEAAKDAA